MNIGCGAHLGDVSWVLVLLSRMPGEHTFYCVPEYIPAITELVEGLPITVKPDTEIPPGTQDGWIANGRFQHLHYTGQEDIMGFVREFMNSIAAENGHPNLLPERYDMLCSFPSFQKEALAQPFDILVINANPLSGQCPHYSQSEMDGLLLQLVAKGHRVLATNATNAAPWSNYSLAQIGNLSTRARLIITSANGPGFMTFNAQTTGIVHHVLIDPMKLDYGPTPIHHHQCAEQVRVKLVEDGWL